MLDWTYKKIRRLVVAVIGATLLLIGLALLVLPGPGVLFILASLAILAAEFVWARQLLKRLKDALPVANGAPRDDADSTSDQRGADYRSGP